MALQTDLNNYVNVGNLFWLFIYFSFYYRKTKSYLGHDCFELLAQLDITKATNLITVQNVVFLFLLLV